MRDGEVRDEYSLVILSVKKDVNILGSYVLDIVEGSARGAFL